MDLNKIALVTGGLGFIGSNFINEVLDTYDSFIIVDNASPTVHGDSKDFKFSSSKIELVIGDIQNANTWNHVADYLPVENFQLDVFHLASNTSTADSILNPSNHVETNVMGTAVMCEFLFKYLESINFVLLTSTRAVYGEGLWINSKGDLVNPSLRDVTNLENSNWNPFFEQKTCIAPTATSAQNCRPNPSNIYGSTKYAQENLLRIWCDTNGIACSILRLQNVYGPKQSLWNSYSGVVSLFVKEALMSSSIQVYEAGGIIRDFVFVSDVVRVMKFAISAPSEWPLVDVGTGRPTTLLKLAEIISDKTSSPRPVVTNMYRAGDVRGIYADNGELMRLMPNFLFTELDKGLDTLIDWAKNEIASR